MLCVFVLLAASPASVTPSTGAAQDEAAHRNAPPKAKGKGKKSDSGQPTDNDLEVETPRLHRGLTLNLFTTKSVSIEPPFMSSSFFPSANLLVGSGRNHHHFPLASHRVIRAKVQQGTVNTHRVAGLMDYIASNVPVYFTLSFTPLLNLANTLLVIDVYANMFVLSFRIQPRCLIWVCRWRS